MTDIFQQASPVEPKTNDTLDGLSENALNAKQEDTEEKKAKNRKLDAETGDIKAKTWLKIGLSIFISLIMAAMYYFQFMVVDKYISHLLELKKEIPESVIISVLAASSSVVTLMGFILKGLFGSKD